MRVGDGVAISWVRVGCVPGSERSRDGDTLHPPTFGAYADQFIVQDVWDIQGA